MHKYEVLRHCAEEFRLALEKYAKEDVKHKSELEWFIERWMPWYKKVVEKKLDFLVMSINWINILSIPIYPKWLKHITMKIQDTR